MISQQGIQKILGIEEEVFIHPEGMAKKMIVAFYPQENKVSENITKAAMLLKNKLVQMGVREIPYSEVFTKIPFAKRYKRKIRLYTNNIIYIVNCLVGNTTDMFFIDRKTIQNLTAKYRYKSNVCIIVPGVLESENLPMQYIKSFKENSIVSILDFPEGIHEESSFESHFDASMEMFAYNMANIVLAVDDTRWMIYNFNASHPIFKFSDQEKLDYYILNGLIPKVVAPISPHRISEFKILKDKYDPSDRKHALALYDLQKGSFEYGKTNLFPPGKSISSLKFRNNFHKQIGKIHLDSRNGMSFGFTAKQLPQKVKMARFIDKVEKDKNYGVDQDFRIDKNGTIFIVCDIENKLVEVEVPEIWVLSLRSGSDKTNFDPEKDVIKMGLRNGKMLLQLSNKVKSLPASYKPSFDTKVILAHAVGNVMNASIAKLFNFLLDFVHNIENEGCSISHWHGYFKNSLIPEHVYEYGKQNPHVACSSPQSAIYALDGKLINFRNALHDGKPYIGDIHVEPHHGSNVCYPKLIDIANHILKDSDTAALGNKYL